MWGEGALFKLFLLSIFLQVFQLFLLASVVRAVLVEALVGCDTGGVLRILPTHILFKALVGHEQVCLVVAVAFDALLD